MLSRLVVGAAAVLILVAAADALRHSGDAPEPPPPAAHELDAPIVGADLGLTGGLERVRPLPPPDCHPPPPRRNGPSVVVLECDHWAAGQIVFPAATPEQG